MKEIDFINARMTQKEVSIPHFLYKYRPFDEYTYDMLDKQYVFLCPAGQLDDKSECKVDFSLQDLYDLTNDQLKFKCVNNILNAFKPFTNDDDFQQVQEIVFRTLTPTGRVRRDYLLEFSFAMQDLMPNIDIAPLINQLGSIPERLDDPNIKCNLDKMFWLAYDARSENGIGVCSLSESKDIDKMWGMYANNYEGYCVQYDMTGYEHLDLLYPVVYQDNRETNIVTSILNTFIGEMIEGISYGELSSDKSHYARLFLTKDTEWAYQKEWRLIGDANQRLPSPSVNVIYLGENASEQNKKQMIEYCKMHNIKVV